MSNDRIMQARFAIKLESVEWDFKGWIKSLLPQRPIIKIGKFGSRRESCSTRRDLLIRYGPILDKHGY